METETEYVKKLVRDLVSGQRVTNSQFDQIYPSAIRKHSETHWTPIKVARRASQLLVFNSQTRVLDVGSGVGKFCFIGALTTPGKFFGIEQRPHLVETARRLLPFFDTKRIEFIGGDLRSIDWTQFDSFYLYNPFIENLYTPENRIDEQGEFSEFRYVEHIRWVQQKLHQLPMGTRVVTYHGFGGDMPPDYRLYTEEPIDTDFLRLWIKGKE